jgi:putative SOS response-associated peptidase YedK
MCGRFTLTADLQRIAERFGVPTASPDAYTAARRAGERLTEPLLHRKQPALTERGYPD